MRRAHRLSFGPVLLGLALLPAPKQQAWVHLGARQVDLRRDRDVLRTASEGRFKHVRVVVEGGDLEMFDVRITFGDGKVFSPRSQFSFKGTSRSRTIRLPGAARIIRWMNFYYRVPGGRQGTAMVHLYARR